MELTKLEQSGFVLETKKGFRLAFDIGNKTPIEKLDIVKPVDAFLVSHMHGDHFSVPHIKKLSPKSLYLNHECLEAIGEENLNAKIIEVKSGDVVIIDEIKVTYFTVDHGPNTSAPVENLGFLIEVENQNIYFAGDMFYESGIDVSNLEMDIVLLPVGTFYTFGPEEAFNFAKKFKKIGKVISMHYEKTPETRKQFTDIAIRGGMNTESYIL